MLRIHKQTLAEKDLEDIWLYSFETHGECQADKYYDELTQGINSLITNPTLGAACNNIKEDYRRLKINYHVIYYKITPDIITIIRVLHEKMEPAKHFND